jgi:hypothetical protein
VKLSELWHMSSVIYKEVTFQSIFSLRSGGLLPSKTDTDVRRLVRNAQFNTLISKVMMSVFIMVFAVMAFFPVTFEGMSTSTSLSLTIMGSVSVFLAVLLFLIVIMGLQVATSFFASDVVVALNALPLTKKDVSAISLLCFARIFDIPLLVAVVGFPVVYLLFEGSVAGSLAALLGVFVTEVFALALTTGLAKFFYTRIAGASGRSVWKTLMRMVLMLVWILPSFGVYIVINFWLEITQFLISLTQTAISLSYAILVIYPFSYGYLVSQATITHNVDFVSLAITAASSVGYFALACGVLGWTGRTIRSVGSVGAISSARSVVKDTRISPQGGLVGIIRKDLRVASRSPSYASILLLPAIQTVILAFSFSAFDNVGLSETLGILVGMSFMTMLLPPTLFSMEGLSSAYTRSLPITKRMLIIAKTMLATITYIISLLVISACTLYLHKSTFFILTYGGAHILTITAANMLETLLLAQTFWKSGFAMGNIYAKLSTYVLVLIPGAIVIFAPVAVAILMMILKSTLILPAFLATASLELALAAVISMYVSRPRSGKPRL